MIRAIDRYWNLSLYLSLTCATSGNFSLWLSFTNILSKTKTIYCQFLLPNVVWIRHPRTRSDNKQYKIIKHHQIIPSPHSNFFTQLIYSVKKWSTRKFFENGICVLPTIYLLIKYKFLSYLFDWIRINLNCLPLCVNLWSYNYFYVFLSRVIYPFNFLKFAPFDIFRRTITKCPFFKSTTFNILAKLNIEL
jgi:hypothetical protein